MTLRELGSVSFITRVDKVFGRGLLSVGFNYSLFWVGK